jgi:hypothetical protein
MINNLPFIDDCLAKMAALSGSILSIYEEIYPNV